MPLAVIKGSFKILGTSPDGDSVRFYPDDPDAWNKAGIKAKPNAQGGVQLRLDAIDALETHYTPPHGNHSWHQPKEFGDGAAAQQLKLLGFKGVQRDERNYVVSASPDAVPGYILTRFADVYGRAVSLVYAGSRSGRTSADGTAYVGVPELRGSVNYKLLAAGWVYPTFYFTLYVDFREALATAGDGLGRSSRGQTSTISCKSHVLSWPGQKPPAHRCIPSPRELGVFRDPTRACFRVAPAWMG